MSGHTPGPWEKSGFDIWGKSPFNARVKLASATVFSPMNGIDTEGNARLIAAAPDSHEANLRSNATFNTLLASVNLTDWQREQIEKAIKINDAAIRKATGAS